MALFDTFHDLAGAGGTFYFNPYYFYKPIFILTEPIGIMKPTAALAENWAMKL